MKELFKLLTILLKSNSNNDRNILKSKIIISKRLSQVGALHVNNVKIEVNNNETNILPPSGRKL